MRFISKHPGYKFIAIHEQVEVLASGLPRTIAPGFICEFSPFDTTDWERDIAREKFKFQGVPMLESGILMDPITRVSSYDTTKIENPELRAKVEQRLLETQGPMDHIHVEKPKRKERELESAPEELVVA